MTVPGLNYPYPLGGHPNGRYRSTLAQASSSAIDPAGSTYLGTLGAAPVATARPTIEDAGIRAGEFIGYRAWFLKPDGLLYSMYIEGYVWSPGAVEHSPQVDPYWGAGLHAFKSIEQAQREYGFYATENTPVVLGEVALWGEVIEHEGGYRAEYAAICQLNVIFDYYSFALGKPKTKRKWPWKFWKPSEPPQLRILRKRYGLPTSPLSRPHGDTP